MSEELPQSERPVSVAPPSVAPPTTPVQVPVVVQEPEPVGEVVEVVEAPQPEEVVAELQVEEPPAVEPVAELPQPVEEAADLEEADAPVEFVPVHAPEPIGASPDDEVAEVQTITISPVNPDQGPRLVAVADPIASVETMVYADEVASHPEIVHGEAGLRVLEPIEGVRTPAQILEQVERARAANAALTAQLASAEAA
jgi:hypothetical protein